jgi:hypothetical protein
MGCGQVLTASPAEDAYQAYLKCDRRGGQESIERLVALGDDGLPYLLRIIRSEQTNRTEQTINKVRLPLVDAIAHIGTDNAANALMQGAQRAKSKIGDPDYAPVWVHALARMGRKGLDRLIPLSKETELVLYGKTFSSAVIPHRQSTSLANHAREAIAEVNDPAAVLSLGQLVDDRSYTIPALTALKRMKAPGYADQMLNIWNNKGAGLRARAAALGYLLTVDRQKYLPLLQKELDALDVEVARLVRDLADLRARKVRDTVADDSVIDLVFELGGDPAANGTLRRYIESRLWYGSLTGLGDRTAGAAVMALGLSRAPDTRPTLLVLLKDATPIDVFSGASFGRYRLDGTGRGSGVPMFIVAAKALQELGDPSVIPDVETLAAVNDPLFKRCFEEVLSALRSASRTNPNIKDGEPSVGGNGKPSPHP